VTINTDAVKTDDPEQQQDTRKHVGQNMAVYCHFRQAHSPIALVHAAVGGQ